jgi:protein SCO1/2
VRVWLPLVVALAVIVPTPRAMAHGSEAHGRLPVIGPAPEFALTSQDGKPVSLGDFRGKAVAVTFIFASCEDMCPVLTALMVRVQEELGPAFGRDVAFVSITVDPERDTPAVLKRYAADFGADLTGWAFLTGAPDQVREVVRSYGVYVHGTPGGDIEHTFLTSLVDPRGNLRVQYLGVRFDLEEFRGDLLDILGEAD